MTDALNRHQEPWRHWVEVRKAAIVVYQAGGIDDWIPVAGPGTLAAHVRTFVKHLGQESFFELF